MVGILPPYHGGYVRLPTVLGMYASLPCWVCDTPHPCWVCLPPCWVCVSPTVLGVSLLLSGCVTSALGTCHFCSFLHILDQFLSGLMPI